MFSTLPPSPALVSSGSLLQDPKTPSPLLQGNQSAVLNEDSRLMNPTYMHQTPLHSTANGSAGDVSDSAVKRMHYDTLPARQQHYYEEAADVVMAAKSEKKKSHKKSKKEKTTHGADKTSQASYNKLTDVRPALSSVPEGRERAQTDETVDLTSLERRRERNQEGSPLVQRTKSPSEPWAPPGNPQQVEFRYKSHSPPLIVEPDTSALERADRTWTPSEIKQVKKLRREKLINDSPITHERRRAPYTEIVLPSDIGSNPGSSRGSTGSESDTASLLAMPTGTDFVDGSQVYDIPTSQNPIGLSATSSGEKLDHTRTPSPVEQHYSVPSSLPAQHSRSPSPSNPHTPTNTTYDVPKSYMQRALSPSSRKSPPQKPLPHLPDDYVNITLKTLPPALAIDDQVYINIDDNGMNGDDVYSEIPANVGVRGSGISELSNGKHPPHSGTTKADLYSSNDTPSKAQLPSYHQPHLDAATPGGFQQFGSEDRIARKSETLARKLASEGYEFVQPAKTPVVTSPKQTSPPIFNGQGNPITDEYVVMQGPTITRKTTSMAPPHSAQLDGDNEYVTVQNQRQVPPGPTATGEKPYVNTPTRTRRRKDGYDEIDSGSILTRQVLQAQKSSAPDENVYENASVVHGPTDTGVTGTVVEMSEEYMNVQGQKQQLSSDGYEKVDLKAVQYGPTCTRAQPSTAAQPKPSVTRDTRAIHPMQAETQPGRCLRPMEKQISSDIGDLVEADVLEDSSQAANSGFDEDEYIIMRPQRQSNSSSGEENLSPDPPLVRANGNKPIPIKVQGKLLVPVAMASPTAETVANRKRSPTTGNALDSFSKKHPYENIDHQTFVPSSPPKTLEQTLSKKPMPLPRPSGVSLKNPTGSMPFPGEQEVGSQSLPKIVARAQSKPVFESIPTAKGTTAEVRRTNSQ